MSANEPHYSKLNHCLKRLLDGAVDWRSLSEGAMLKGDDIHRLLTPLVEEGVLELSADQQVYQYAPHIRPLELSVINESLRELSAVKQPISTELFCCIDSTSEYLLNRTDSSRDPRLAIAEMQLSGRGRRGNHWSTLPFSNIAMSFAYRFEHWPDDVSTIALAIAVSLVVALRERFAINVEIKWPNDLLIKQQKLAGILLEASGKFDGECRVVAGVGLNVDQPDQSKLSDGAGYTWTALKNHTNDVDRGELCAIVGAALLSTFEVFAKSGFAPYKDAWNRMSAYHGCEVEVGVGDTAVTGVQVGVNDVGALLVEKVDGSMMVLNDVNTRVRLKSDEA